MKKTISRLLLLSILVSSLGIVRVNASTLPNEGEITVSQKIYLSEDANNWILDDIYQSKDNNIRIHGGVGTATYLYSTYKYKEHVMTLEDCKPYKNHTFLDTVAKGGKTKLTNTVEISGTMTISVPELASGIFKAIAKGLNLSASGQIKHKFSKEYELVWPTDLADKYNACRYYTAIGFDKVKVTVKKYNWYLPNGVMLPIKYSKYIEDQTYTVYKPFVVIYYRGSTI